MAMTRFRQGFGYGTSVLKQEEPITMEQLFDVAPSIFAESKHNSRTERYTYIPTIEILKGLINEGFKPFMAAQGKCRIKEKEDFTKHMIRLRTENNINKPETHEIILINSHDGTSSYQMMAGTFRFVCHNGLVDGDIIQDIKIPHRGNIVDNVIEAAYTIVDNFDKVEEHIGEMKSLPVNNEEAEIFAKAALALKYEDDNAPIKADKLLTTRRYEDNKDNSLWTRFNVIQENIMKGGLHGHSSNGRRITTRPVQSIDSNIKLNKALWILAEEMKKLKR